MFLRAALAVLLSATFVRPALAADTTIVTERLPDLTAKWAPPWAQLGAQPVAANSAPRRVQPLHKLAHFPNEIVPEAPVQTPLQQKLARQTSSPRVKTAPGPLKNFAGLAGTDVEAALSSSFTPSDVNGDVGLNHYVQMVNGLYQVFDKITGNPITTPTRLSSLFAAAGVAGPCAEQDQGDPIALYDGLAKRWVLSQFNFNVNGSGTEVPPFHQCIAISTSDDPTGSYYVYDFIIPNNYFGDYPKFGVWPSGYYMTIAQYKGNQSAGTGVMVFNRAQMLQGKTAGVNYRSFAQDPTLGLLLPSDVDGAGPPAGTPNYLVGFDTNPSTGMPTNKLRMFEYTSNFSTAQGSLREIAALPVTAFNPNVCQSADMVCVSQPLGYKSAQQKLDALSDRPLYRLQYRYFANGCPVNTSFSRCATLVFNHTIRGGFSGQAAVRWYQLTQNPTSKAWSVTQQNTFAPGTASRWMGSAAMNKRGDLAIGYSVSSTQLFPSIAYAGRLVTDPRSTLTLEGRLFTGGGAQSGGSERWGDYTALSVDPVDGCTFWYTNQYYANNQDGYNWRWKTRIGSFRLASSC